MTKLDYVITKLDNLERAFLMSQNRSVLNTDKAESAQSGVTSCEVNIQLNTDGITDNSNGLFDVAEFADENSNAIFELADYVAELEERIIELEGK